MNYLIDNNLKLSFESERFGFSFIDASANVISPSITDSVDYTIYIIDVEAEKANEIANRASISADTNIEKILPIQSTKITLSGTQSIGLRKCTFQLLKLLLLR